MTISFRNAAINVASGVAMIAAAGCTTTTKQNGFDIDAMVSPAAKPAAAQQTVAQSAATGVVYDYETPPAPGKLGAGETVRIRYIPECKGPGTQVGADDRKYTGDKPQYQRGDQPRATRSTRTTDCDGPK